MLNKDTVGERKSYYYKYNSIGRCYDWKHKGILNHTMSKAVTLAPNEILQYTLGILESSLSFVLSYIDKLRDFKNYNKCNR